MVDIMAPLSILPPGGWQDRRRFVATNNKLVSNRGLWGLLAMASKPPIVTARRRIDDLLALSPRL